VSTHENSISLNDPRRNGSYNAVLRYHDIIGEESVVGEYRPRHRFEGDRALIGLAVAVALLPVAYVLNGWVAPSVFGLTVLIMVAAAIGGIAADIAARRQIQTWAGRISKRILDHPLDSQDRALDTQTYLNKLTDSLEATLEGQARRHRDVFVATISSLVSALEARDRYTRDHSANVAKLAVRIGKQMGLEPSRLYEFHLGGLLHDLGKIGIRDDVLLKPAGLSREEYEMMKEHPELGARILSGFPGLEEVTRIVLHHHEMYDGRGYPAGLRGEEIPMGARVVAIADTYLSLAEDRPYRKARSLEKTIAEMRRVAGAQLDPVILEHLFVLLREDEAFRTKEVPAELPTPAKEAA
jgi:putative nucleotidyltransferase with HDIG domain